MDAKKMHQIIADAMLACEQRSRELSQAFGK
jgi:pyrroline-5-carboxylate reductase